MGSVCRVRRLRRAGRRGVHRVQGWHGEGERHGSGVTSNLGAEGLKGCYGHLANIYISCFIAIYYHLYTPYSVELLTPPAYDCTVRPWLSPKNQDQMLLEPYTLPNTLRTELGRDSFKLRSGWMHPLHVDILWSTCPCHSSRTHGTKALRQALRSFKSFAQVHLLAYRHGDRLA